MKLLNRLVLALGALILASSVYAQQPTPPAEPSAPPAQSVLKPETVVAKVNGAPITGQQVIDSVTTLPPQLQQQAGNLYPQLVQRLVSLKLISDKARAEKVTNDPEFKTLMAKYEEDALREIFLRHYVASVVTDEMIKARYDENLAKNPPQPEMRASHILVDTEKEAKDLIAQIKKGADFAKLAQDKSKDKATAVRGGDLGYFTATGVVKEFSDAAFALKPGQVTDKPVKSQFGWHIIKVVDVRTQTPPSFDQQKDQIRGALAEEQVQKLVADLKKSAQIETFNPDGSPLAPVQQPPAQ